MKIGYAAALLLLIATPALSATTKTDNGVTFTCEVTGSDKDGFSITAKNDGKTDTDCTASCKLTKSDKNTQEWSYPKSGTIKVRSGPARMYFGGEAGLSGKPLSNPDVTKASCK
jgi:hypothetical protein